ncbi:hypothetical protein DPMN_051230 [Dreissena polymorpha]|uniref:Uncharacterized protein n=1 Tax=Dreissena polymorpha TaxID=45954 RepID=A0A9D4HLY8_DREPO|nr:hypothetical protein DPMN_051230 [Dreissena polymorpha]
MNDIVMARTSLFRPPASQSASLPAFANLITSFFLRKTWLKTFHEWVEKFHLLQIVESSSSLDKVNNPKL